jgi:WD40 repeat protein
MFKRVLLLLLVLLMPSYVVFAQSIPFIDVALADLNTHLGTTYTLDQISWRWSQEVYPDASLDCPQPDQAYAQVQTSGYRFVFEVAGVEYDYRADQAGAVRLCQSIALASTPVPATPAPTLAAPSGSLINASSAGELATVAQLELFTTADARLAAPIAWLADNVTLAVGTPTGIAFYDTSNTTRPPETLELEIDVKALISFVEGDVNYLVISGVNAEGGIVAVIPATPNALDIAVLGEALPRVANAITISANAEVVAAAFDDGVTFWARQTSEIVLTIPLAASALAFSPDGTFLATGTERGSLLLWNTASGAQVRAFDGHRAAVRALAFSADGARLASGSDDGTARLWNVAEGEWMGTYDNATEDAVLALTLSEDGALLTTIGGNPEAFTVDNSGRVWSVSNFSVVGDLVGHEASVRFLLLSPDGTRYASSSDDGTLRIWGVRSNAVG